MDRVGDADDNAERLFEYSGRAPARHQCLVRARSEVPDWARLNAKIADGRRARLAALEAADAQLRASDLLARRRTRSCSTRRWSGSIPKPTWKFTFLQHGVIKDDISGWLNAKRSTCSSPAPPAEHRVDRRRRHAVRVHPEGGQAGRAGPLRPAAAHRASRSAESEQDLILVAPTWRSWLNAPLAPGEHRAEVVANFADTEYARNWFGLLKSHRAGAVCVPNRPPGRLPASPQSAVHPART